MNPTNTAALMAGAAIGLLTAVIGAPLWGAIVVGGAGALLTKAAINRSA